MIKNVISFFLLLFLTYFSSAQVDKGSVNKPRLVVPDGHTGVITKLNVSNKGELLTSYGYQEGLSKLWDLQTGKQLEIDRGSNSVSHYKSYEITPNGRYISISSLSGIDVLEIGSNKLVFQIEDSVFSAYSHDKSQLLVGEKGSNRYRIYSTENFELVREIKELPDFMFIHAYSFLELDSQNDLLYLRHTTYSDNTSQDLIAIVDLKTEKITKIPVNGNGLDGESIFSFGINSNSLLTAQYVSGDGAHTVFRIYDKTTGENVNEVRLTNYIDEFGVTENEAYLWCRQYDNYGWSEQPSEVWIYDLIKQEEVETLSLDYYQLGNEEFTTKYFTLNDWIAFDPKYDYHDPSKTYYVTCPDIPSLKSQLGMKIFEDYDYGYYVEVRNIQTDTIVSTIETNRNFRYYTASFVNNGTNVILAFENEIGLYDAFSGRKIRSFDSNTEDLTVVDADSSEENIAVGTKSGNVHILQRATNRFTTIHPGEQRVNDLLIEDDILVCGGGNFLQTWDLKTNELILDFSSNEDNWIGSVTDLELVKVGDKKYLKTNEWYLLDDEVIEENVYDLSTGEKLINSHDIISFSPEAVIFRQLDSAVYVWDFGDTSRNLSSFFPTPKYDFYGVDDLEVSPNGRFIITVYQKKLKIWDLKTGKVTKELKFDKIESYYSYLFDRKYENVFFTDLYNVYQLDVKSGKLIRKWKGYSDVSLIQDFLVLKNRDKFGTIFIHDVSNGELKYEIENKGDVIEYLKDKNLFVLKEALSNRILYYDPDKSQVVATNVNELNLFKEKSKIFDETEATGNFESGNFYGILRNELLRFNIYDGELNYRLIPLGANQMITVLPNGHYQASKDAAKLLHYVTDDLKIITFDQLDIRYNRPDKVLQVLGSTDTLLINSYRSAYEKRIRKMGVDTTLFNDAYSVPEVDFVDRELIAYKMADKYLKLQIRGWDSTFYLDRFNVWVNEVPLFGERGITLKGRKLNYFDTTLTIELTPGQNRFEASLFNFNQIESYRKPLYVNYEPEKTIVPRTYFIGIGIDKFSEPGHDLSYSVKDLRDLSKALKQKLGDRLTIDTLFNQNVSVSNVIALKKKLLQTDLNDRVIISYSGHGLLNEHYDYFLSSYTVDFEQPENGGIPYDVLEDLLDSIPARKKLLLIDACHSGEVDKEDFRQMKEVAGAKGIVKPKGGDTESTVESPTVGLQNSFQLMQELFVNVQKGSGATIISAAAGDQFALEGGKIENGFFTYAILKYMQEHKVVNINELKKYVYAEVEQLSGGMQKPTSRIENLELNWSIVE